MIRGENILCISSIDWDFIWQGHQEIMSTLAAQGNRVLFIENTGVRRVRLSDWSRLQRRLRNWRKGIGGIRQERERLYVYSPLVLPFPYSRLARRINRWLLLRTIRRWMKAMDFYHPIIWTFLPTAITIDLVRQVDYKLLIYYCIDSFIDSSAAAKRIVESERRLIAMADLVFVTSHRLQEHCRPHNAAVHVFPFGVSSKWFDGSQPAAGEAPPDIAAIPHPRIGYVGGLHQWVDQPLLAQLAQRQRGYSFVFVGPIQTDVATLQRQANVHFLGQKPAEQLPQYIQAFDVCLIPYRLTDYTHSVYPTKLNEYLALGKPVISTALPEVSHFNERHGALVLLGRTPEEFAQLVDRALHDTGDGELLERRRSVARLNTWDVKMASMSALIAEAIQRRQTARASGWQEAVVRWIRRSRHQFLRWAVGSALLYGLAFHTPLVWWAASPLKVADPLRPVDAIIVLGGGVGESGRAGQGYEERIQYAVQLYRDGYAPALICSSGYVFVIQEAEVMKALAVSLGVPEQAIILEQRSANTYQNAVYTAEILRHRGWHSAMVVTSPYHARRVTLVYQTVAPDLTVLLAPLPHSVFFGGGGPPVQLRQMQAILHEYAGIVYYRFKGYIRPHRQAG
ncbi:MAG: YdcF family protein [Candidatus Omnitrophica bacterium]|nr:YdcF family protein [Candidatus Omnitrophota bacterium]